MISFIRKTAFAVLLTCSLAACGTHRPQPNKAESASIGNAVYYWRTTFDLSESENAFLRLHNIRRIYLRMFDVAVEYLNDSYEIVPIATTCFSSEIPHDVQIVPTVYITLEALREMKGDEAKYAGLIIERLKAMVSYNGCGTINEIQFDCDWTSSTRTTYHELCRAAGKLLHNDKIALSSTIRLHQLKEEAPPVDYGVLMLYNTGALKSPTTRNSIIDIEDVSPFTLYMPKCNIPLDYAYPAFGWGVKFHDGKFQRIVTYPETEPLGEGDTIRIERPTIEAITRVKELVESKLGAPSRYRIIYHLDNKQLKYYTDDEITEIYANC